MRAGTYQLSQPDVTLVQAVIRSRFGPYIHSWCELPEGLAFDGSDNAL